jgi:hypothetical protein
MKTLYTVLSFLVISVLGYAQSNVPEPRVLNEEFHKVHLQVISVIPNSNNHAVVSVKEVKRANPKASFTPAIGELFMASFFYTTQPSRSIERFRELGFVLPGVKPGDIISCQLLGDPSPTDSKRVNWKIYEYVVLGNEPIQDKE